MKRVFWFSILLFIQFGIVNAQQVQVAEDGLAVICDTDLNGGIAADTVYVCNPSTEGTTIMNGLCAEYVPNLNYFGYDSVCLTYCVGAVCTDTVIQFTVYPVGEIINETTPEDANYFICESTLSGGNNVVISGCGDPEFGTYFFNPACVVYDPPTNYVGTDTFCVVSCIDTLCDTSTVMMTITGVTETITASVPGSQTYEICYPQLLTVVDTVQSIGLACAPTNGTVVIDPSTNCVTYTPDASFVGTGLTGNDQICIEVCNSQGICDVTNVNISITGFNVVNNSNATQLAESLAGTGVTITNASMNCDAVGTGFFENANTALGISDGVILSNGNAVEVQNPPAFFASTGLNGGGDPDLDGLIASSGLVTTDVCVLEFDIEVLGDSLEFSYVFGSEEYESFVCNGFNDVFGFFISGPNPAGGNYVNQNVALIPGTTTPVSINTVNDGTPNGSDPGCQSGNTQYYNFTPLNDVAFYGRTQRMVAKAEVIPCNTYHFKLGVGDGSTAAADDRIYDSGVFLESGSFSSLPVTLSSASILGDGFQNAVENCVDGLFSFELDEALPYTYGIKFQIGGDAINGVDYQLIQDSITFFPGDTIVEVQIIPINDGLTEGPEEVKLYLLNQCTNQPLDSAIISIIDLIPYNLDIVQGADSICPGDTTVLHATIAGDDADLADYLWSSDFGTIIDPDSGYTTVYSNVSANYYLEYTLGTCTQYDTLSIFASQFSNAIDTTPISCPGANDGQLAALPLNAIGNVTYDWQPVNLQDSLIQSLGPDTFYLTVMDESGLSCGTLMDTAILIEPTELSFSFDTTNVLCFGANDGAVLVADLTPNTSYDVTVTYNGAVLPTQTIVSDASGEFQVLGLSPGVYDSILLTNTTSGCSNTFGFNIDEPDSLIVSITTPGVVLCSGGAVDTLATQVTGGISPFSYLWNTTDNTPFITGVSSGTYWVEVTDTNGCVAVDSFIVSQPDPLYLELATDSVNCFGGSDGLAYVDSISGGTPTYSYSWSANSGGQITDSATNLSAGTYILTATDFNGCTIMDTIELYEYPSIQINYTSTNVVCFGDTNGAIDVSIVGGYSPYTYSWTGPNGFTASTEDVSSLLAGNYTLTITDSLLCQVDTLIQITEPTALSLTIDSTNINCAGAADGTATVTATGGTPNYTYLWNDPAMQNTATATNLDTGFVQVLVTDNNGCQDSINVTLTQPDSLLLSVDTIIDVFCNGDATGSAQITTIGGTLPYDFSWSNGGGTNEDLTNAAAGNYTLTVTDDNNCVRTVAVTINEPTALDLTFTQTDVSCFDGNDGAIDASASGGVGNYTYSWTGPNAFTAATEDITTLIAGTYTLTVTDSNNCTHAESVTINQPATVVVGFTTNDVNCFGGNDGSITANIQSGGTAPFTYQWDANANNQVGPTATGLIAGTYVVTVTDDNGCSFVDSATIGEPATPLSVTADSTDVTCASLNDGTALATAQGGTSPYTYLWNDPQGQTSALADNLSGNTSYQVTVTDANGCTATASTFINEPTPIGVSLLADSANCWGDATGSITVLASGGTGVGYSYSIDGGETFQSDSVFNNLPAGNYDEIIVQDIGSNVYCVSDVNQTFVYESPYFSFEVSPGDTIVQLEESVPLVLEVTSPNYTNASIAQVTWFPTTGLNCSDCIDPIVLTYDPYTEYTATVYYYGDDDELCNATSNTIIIVENNLKLFIPNAFTPSTFDDVNSVFEVYGEGIEYITMQIYNRWGEKIFESANQKVAWDGTFKGELQNPGVYTYYVSVEYLDGKTIDRKGSVTLIR